MHWLMRLMRSHYRQRSVQLGGCLSRKVDCKDCKINIVKFRTSTNLELQTEKIARNVADGGILHCQQR